MPSILGINDIVFFKGQIHQTTSLMRWDTVEVLSVAEKFLVV